MPRLTAYIALLSSSIFLSACDFAEEIYMKARYSGTSKIVTWCISNNEESFKLLGVDPLRHCSNIHQKYLYPFIATGRAEFICSKPQNGKPQSLWVYVNNESQNIITSVSISVTILRAEIETTYILKPVNTWIRPNTESSVSMSIPSEIDCSDVSYKNNSWPYNWQFNDVKGISMTSR
jgi:hypothetical protein